MSIFDRLLEYDDPLLQGTPLNKSDLAKYDPARQMHHRHHETQAGLYVVLRHHQDGKIQKHEHHGEGSYSFSYAITDWQSEALPNLFTFKGNLYHFDPAVKKSVTKSTTYHHSGIRIIHVTDSLDETILSVELSGWMKFEEMNLPAWRLRIQRNPAAAPYRSNAYPTVEGNIFSYQKNAIEQDGRVRTAASPSFEGKRLDYENSMETILNLMGLYFVSRNRENIAKHLNSPGCLSFE